MKPAKKQNLNSINDLELKVLTKVWRKLNGPLSCVIFGNTQPSEPFDTALHELTVKHDFFL